MVSLIPLLTLALSVLGLAIRQPDSQAELAPRSGPKVLQLDLNIDKSKPSGKRDGSAPKVLQLDFNVDRSSRKRDATAEIDDNRDVRYFMDMYFGSNKQKVQVEIDTGSSDLWVHDEIYGPSYEGYFKQSESDTFNYINEKFEIHYFDGSACYGQFGTDNVALEDGTVVKDFQFAVVNKATDGGTPAIFGISRKVQENAKHQYDNFPYALVTQGIIDKPAYSIYMSKEGGDKGLVLFGGIDKKKYEGSLVSFPISDDYFCDITLESLDVDGKEYSLSKSAMLDTGTSWNFFPDEIVDDISDRLGAKINDDGDRVIDCNQPTDKYITFNFGTQEIQLTYADFVVRPFKNGCLAGISYWNPKNGIILGDVFLRRTYTVYDFESDTISIAQAVDTDESDIVQIP